MTDARSDQRSPVLNLEGLSPILLNYALGWVPGMPTAFLNAAKKAGVTKVRELRDGPGAALVRGQGVLEADRNRALKALSTWMEQVAGRALSPELGRLVKDPSDPRMDPAQRRLDDLFRIPAPGARPAAEGRRAAVEEAGPRRRLVRPGAPAVTAPAASPREPSSPRGDRQADAELSEPAEASGDGNSEGPRQRAAPSKPVLSVPPPPLVPVPPSVAARSAATSRAIGVTPATEANPPPPVPASAPASRPGLSLAPSPPALVHDDAAVQDGSPPGATAPARRRAPARARPAATVDPDDQPIHLAMGHAEIPKVLTTVGIDQLQMHWRLQRAVGELRCRTLADLLATTPNQWAAQPAAGRQSMDSVIRVLTQYLEQDSIEPARLEATNRTSDMARQLKEFLGAERYEVFEARVALPKGSRPQALLTLSSRLGLHPEAIRQHEMKALGRIQDAGLGEPLMRAFSAHFSRLSMRRQGLVSMDELEEDRFFNAWGCTGILRLWERLGGTPPVLVDEEYLAARDGRFCTRADLEALAERVTEWAGRLAERACIPLDDAVERFGRLPQGGPRIPDDLVEWALRRSADLTEVHGGLLFVGQRNRALVQVADALIADRGGPVTVQAIRDAMEQQLHPALVPGINLVHTTLLRYPQFRRVAPATFDRLPSLEPAVAPVGGEGGEGAAPAEVALSQGPPAAETTGPGAPDADGSNGTDAGRGSEPEDAQPVEPATGDGTAPEPAVLALAETELPAADSAAPAPAEPETPSLAPAPVEPKAEVAEPAAPEPAAAVDDALPDLPPLAAEAHPAEAPAAPPTDSGPDDEDGDEPVPLLEDLVYDTLLEAGPLDQPALEERIRLTRTCSSAAVHNVLRQEPWVFRQGDDRYDVVEKHLSQVELKRWSRRVREDVVRLGRPYHREDFADARTEGRLPPLPAALDVAGLFDMLRRMSGFAVSGHLLTTEDLHRRMQAEPVVGCVLWAMEREARALTPREISGLLAERVHPREIARALQRAPEVVKDGASRYRLSAPPRWNEPTGKRRSSGLTGV